MIQEPKIREQDRSDLRCQRRACVDVHVSLKLSESVLYSANKISARGSCKTRSKYCRQLYNQSGDPIV